MWGRLFGKSVEESGTELQDFSGHTRNYPKVEKDIDEDFVMIDDSDLLAALPDAESRKLVNELVEDLAKLDLDKVKTEQDVINHIIEMGLKRDKHIDAKSIREYFKANNIDIDKSLKAIRDGKWTKTEFALKMGVTIAGLVAVHWFAGPYAAIAGRALYSKAYAALWGIPSAWNPLYYAVYLPGREHIGYAAYKYAPWAVNALGGWFYHKTVDGVKLLGQGAVGAYNWAMTPKAAQAEAPKMTAEQIKAERDKMDSTRIETDFAKLAQKMEAMDINNTPVFFKSDKRAKGEALFDDVDVSSVSRERVKKEKEEMIPAFKLTRSRSMETVSKQPKVEYVMAHDHPLARSVNKTR